jgi:hypothetical protein
VTQGPEQNTAAVRATADETAIRKTVQSHAYQRSVVEVHQEFDQLDPQAISDACRAWKRAADELLALAEGIKAEAAVPLSAAWNSPASPAAQQQLQQAEATVRALASDCLQMAHATDYAAQYAQWYKDNLPSYAESLGTGVKGMVTGQGMTGAAKVAVEYLENLLTRYNEVIQILPNSVHAQFVDSRIGTFTPSPLPPPDSGVGGTGAPTVGGVGGFPAGAGPSAVGHGTAVPGAHDVGSGPAGAGPSGSGGPGSFTTGGGHGSGPAGFGSGGLDDPYAAGSSLAGSGLGGGLSGFDPNALGGASVGGSQSGLGAGLGAGALGATGLGAGGLAGGLGAGRGGAGRAGAGGAGLLGGPGAGGMAGSGMAAEGAVAGRGGMVPMHGAAGHGEGEEERERSTWLMEDDDVWGCGGDAPPPVITS